MAKLLYITCDLRPDEESCSLIAGRCFQNEYLKWNPRDEIYWLDLYRDSIPAADADVLNAFEKLGRGHHLATLTTVEQRKISRIWDLADQFAATDKYVLVTPMWKPGFPSELWAYLDLIQVPGKTYRNTVRGPEGLLNDRERKCLLIHGPEGFCYGDKELHCVAQVRGIMRFLGILEFRSFVVAGVSPSPGINAVPLEKEIGKVVAAAAGF